MKSQSSVRCTRVLDSSGELRHLADAQQTQKILASGAFRELKRKKRVRALVPFPGCELAADDVLRDLDAVTYDQGRSIRAGQAHRLETNDNPRGVVTISRIPASLRHIFTVVVDEMAAAA